MQPKTSIGRNFQDGTLSRLAERNQLTTIYLRNRMSLRGHILDFDPYVVLLQPLDGSPLQMVYKSAIVSVAGPPRPQRRGRPLPRRPDDRGPQGYGYPRRDEEPEPRAEPSPPAEPPTPESA